MDVKSIGLRRRMTLPPPIAARTPNATYAFGQHASPSIHDVAGWELSFLCQTVHAARGDHICIYEQRTTPDQGQRLHKLFETPPASGNSNMPYPCVAVQMGGVANCWVVLNPQECRTLCDDVKGTFPDVFIAMHSLYEREGYPTFLSAYKAYAGHATPANMTAGTQLERSLLRYASQQTSDESAWRQVAYFGEATAALLPLAARSQKAFYAPAQTLASRDSYASVYSLSRKASGASLRSIMLPSPTSSLSASDSWETASQASRHSSTTPDMVSLESFGLRPARTQGVSPASSRLPRGPSLDHAFDAAFGSGPHVAYAPDTQTQADAVPPSVRAKSYLPLFFKRSTQAASRDVLFFDSNAPEMPHE